MSVTTGGINGRFNPALAMRRVNQTEHLQASRESGLGHDTLSLDLYCHLPTLDGFLSSFSELQLH